jgi:hypothetical protein
MITLHILGTLAPKGSSRPMLNQDRQGVHLQGRLAAERGEADHLGHQRARGRRISSAFRTAARSRSPMPMVLPTRLRRRTATAAIRTPPGTSSSRTRCSTPAMTSSPSSRG